jgi:hypothetical protein
MSNNTHRRSEEFRNIQWGAAVYAGLLAGAIFLIVNHGLPWFTSGLVSPSVMGRDVKPPETIDGAATMQMMGLHLVLSVLYALVLAPFANIFHRMAAVWIGGLVGAALYAMNYLAFEYLLGRGPAQNELATALTHIAFGMVAAGFYRGFRRVPASIESHGSYS